MEGLLSMALFLIGLACMLALAFILSDKRDEPRRRKAPDRSSAPLDDISEQIERDPAGALGAYGTPEDAARLQAEGVDLAGLGYRPPEG